MLRKSLCFSININILFCLKKDGNNCFNYNRGDLGTSRSLSAIFFLPPEQTQKNISSPTQRVSDYGAKSMVTAPKLLPHNWADKTAPKESTRDKAPLIQFRRNFAIGNCKLRKLTRNLILLMWSVEEDWIFRCKDCGHWVDHWLTFMVKIALWLKSTANKNRSLRRRIFITFFAFLAGKYSKSHYFFFILQPGDK